MNITETDSDFTIDDNLTKLLVPIIGGSCYIIKGSFKAIVSKLCPKVRLDDEESNVEEDEEKDIKSRKYDDTDYDIDEDVDVVLDNIWEPPGVKDRNRYTRITGSTVSIVLPPGELEEIKSDTLSSSYNKEKPKPKKGENKVLSYNFELKENGNNYAICDGLYVLKKGSMINKKPIYINKEKDRFLAALGPTGWCITAMQYLDGIIEMKTGSFGGFHSGGGVSPDYGKWPNYNVSVVDQEKEEEKDSLLPKSKETVQGTVNIYREFDFKPVSGKYFFETELRSVTPNMVKLFIKRFDKDYNFSKTHSHEYKKAKNGMNILEVNSLIGEEGIKFEQVGIMVYSAEIEDDNKKKIKNNNPTESRCIIKSTYLKDRPKKRKK